MTGLIERLRKYLPLSNAATGIGDFPSDTSAAPGGIIMWNLIVNDILKAEKSESRDKSYKGIDITASRQSLFDEIDPLIFWCQASNQTPTQVSEKLSATVVSIASRHVQQYKVRKVGEAKKQLSKFAKRQNPPRGFKKEILDCLPQLMKASQCQMGNDGMFIEALLTPLAAALVASEGNGPEKMFGYKIWQFVILNSNSAVRNHGLYFLRLMMKYGDWLHSLPYVNKASFVAITEEQNATYFGILRQILLCVQAMAIREDPPDSILHANVKGQNESYLEAVFYTCGGGSFARSQYHDSPHPLLEELMVTHLILWERQKMGGLSQLKTLAEDFSRICETNWYPDGKTFNPDLLKYLFPQFMNLTTSYFQQECNTVEELPQLGEYLRSTTWAVIGYCLSKIKDESAAKRLLEKLGNIMDVYVDKMLSYFTTNMTHDMAYNLGRSVYTFFHTSTSLSSYIEDQQIESALVKRLEKLNQAAQLSECCKCYHNAACCSSGPDHYFFRILLGRKDILPFKSYRRLLPDYFQARRLGTSDHYAAVFAQAPRSRCESVKPKKCNATK